MGVLASGLPISIPLYTTGIFMPVWEREFGWSRAEIALATSCYMLALALVSPFMGGVVDRYGARRPIVLSLVGGVASVAALSMIGGRLGTHYLGYFVLALLSVACTPAALTRPISIAFERGRGLAFGVTLSATTVSMLATPPITYALLDACRPDRGPSRG